MGRLAIGKVRNPRPRRKGGGLTKKQWLIEKGCPVDAGAAASAAEKGNLEVLQWLHANGCPMTARVIIDAARNGHDDVVEWARAHGCPGPSDAALDFMMFGDQFADQIMAHFGVPDGAIPIPIHLPIAAMDALDGPGGLGQHIATAVAAAAAGEAGPVALGPPNCAIM